MASREDEVSYSGGFGPYIIDGLRGYADSNGDGIVTLKKYLRMLNHGVFRNSIHYL